MNGWAQLLAIAGNAAAITERSFGVPDGVANGQFGVGLVIDFFGLAAKNSGLPVEFVYPSVTAIVPANIALVAGSKAPDAGKRFIQFALSDDGQALLLDKQISRLPVLPATYAKAPAGYPNPFSGTIRAKVNFDSNLSESRYYVVVALFDQLITFRHKELAAATKAIHEAQKRLGTRTSRELDEARRLVLTPPIDEKQAADKALLATFAADKKDADASKRRTLIEEEWASKAKASYARAIELANAVK
jgi:ABC-type glycerol-3-phosphate transport system substrate-binding protein